MNMNKVKLTVPCQWNMDSIKKIIDIHGKDDIEIAELYGALSNGKLPQGRDHTVAHQTTRNEANKIKRILENHKIRFAYLINTPVNMQLCEYIEEELEWIINDFKTDSLTISSIELFEFIRRRYPSVHINVSTIAGIKTIDDIKPYLSLEPSKIIAHHDLNRNFDDLTNIIEFLGNENIDFEIMVNESCLRRCPFREQHYQDLGEGKSDRAFHEKCNEIKIQTPYQILMANFIRPEDLRLYESMGVNFFKITGRSKPIGWLEEVVYAYMNRQYNGNLFRLLGTDPLLEVEKKVFLANKALTGFLDKYPKLGKVDEEIEYCEQWIKELFENNNFKLESIAVNPHLSENKLRFSVDGNIY